MHFTAGLSFALALLVAGTHACNCAHNGDAGRWVDSNSPAAVASSLVNRGGGCYDATVQGHMCVSLDNANQAVRDCLSAEAANQQSYHNDWFLWTAITCSDGAARAQLTIT
ncbi:hypothetical protein AURDEDRAFT_164322 [Auricularia subglabra TFB-10046 SS5]|nr:hypothetical protein AURDEDRAFT_164322 [Auricularia subglabra TFB-10046 SS5]